MFCHLQARQRSPGPSIVAQAMNPVRVFVNGVALELARGASALDAVALADRKEAEEVAAGRRMITDSRGLAIPASSEVFAGAIFRTVRAKPLARDPE